MTIDIELSHELSKLRVRVRSHPIRNHGLNLIDIFNDPTSMKRKVDAVAYFALGRPSLDQFRRIFSNIFFCVVRKIQHKIVLKLILYSSGYIRLIKTRGLSPFWEEWASAPNIQVMSLQFVPPSVHSNSNHQGRKVPSRDNGLEIHRLPLVVGQIVPMVVWKEKWAKTECFITLQNCKL